MSEGLPQQVGPYRILRRLGGGGMAEVFLGRASAASGFERLVAVKVPRREFRGDAEVERLLIREAQLGGRLRHRNLVGVTDLGCDLGTYFLVMDFVEGADLAALTESSTLPPPLAVYVAGEILLGLHYLHGACDDKGRPLGLVHRDVSPGNVLISRQGEVILADYGIAKALNLASHTRPGIRRGAYAYMSPEQVAGEQLGARSDQFGVGVALLELLSGGRPFDTDAPAEAMYKIADAGPEGLDRIEPAGLRDAIARALTRDPARRFPDAAAMRRALLEGGGAAVADGPVELGRWVAAQMR